MKRIFSILIGMIFIFSVAFGAGKYKIMMSDNASGKIDINTATREQMLRSGVAESYVNKIVSFRDVKGGIENIDELSRISGIGEKTCRKLEKYFVIKDVPQLKNLYINKADDKVLSYYGFDKKEIKKIRKYLEKNEKIKNNIELKKIISKDKYDKYIEIIKFDIY